jgi:DNA repair protein RecO (recombination protein O)
VRFVPYGEHDAVVTLFTEQLGTVAALARGARSVRRRGSACFEPMHTLDVTLRERSAQGLLAVVSSRIAVPRMHLLGELARMQAAGSALRWVRKAAPARTAEPLLWAEIVALLDALDASCLSTTPAVLLATAGLRVLRHLGYGLNLSACVSCGRACAPGRPAHVDAPRGGLVCRRCGGAGFLLSGDARARLAAAAAGAGVLASEDARAALDLVDLALLAHAHVTR